MYSNTSMISTVEGGGKGEGMKGKEGSESRGSEVRGPIQCIRYTEVQHE